MKKAFFVGVSLALCCLLCACGGGDEEGGESTPTVTTYTLGGDTIPALEEVLTPQTGGTLVATLTTPPPTAEDAAAQEEAAEGEPAEGEEGEETPAETEEEAPAEEEAPSDTYIAYDYQQFVQGQSGAAAGAYYALLTDEANALRLEGDEAALDFTAAAGSVSLYRQAVLVGSDGTPTLAASAAPAEDSAEDGEAADGENTDEGKTDEENSDDAAEAETPPEDALLPYSSYQPDGQTRFSVRIDWTPSSCLITLERSFGQDFNSSLQDVGTFLSFSSAKVLLNAVKPEEIGLPGESMSEYSLKPGPGFVMVDGRACLTVYAYRINEQNTNSLAATYFISSDSSTLYRQIGAGQVEEIDVPDVEPEEDPAAAADGSAEGGEDSGEDAAPADEQPEEE